MHTTRSGRAEASSGAIAARVAGDQDIELRRQVSQELAEIRVAHGEQRDRLVPGLADRGVEPVRHGRDAGDDDDAPAA
jgi:hypothetical protein